jgi:hypothetical protein
MSQKEEVIGDPWRIHRARKALERSLPRPVYLNSVSYHLCQEETRRVIG